MLSHRRAAFAFACAALMLAGCDSEAPARDYELLAYRVHPVNLAVGADRVWWADRPSEYADPQLQAMQLDDAPIDGLNRTPLATIAGPLAPYTGSLYAATLDGIGVWPFAGGDPSDLVTMGPTPLDLFVDRDLVYWVTDAPPAVHWMDKTGGLPEHVELPEGVPARVLADADAVYVMTDAELFRIGKANRELTSLAAASDYGLLLPASGDSQGSSIVASDIVLGDGLLIWMITRHYSSGQGALGALLKIVVDGGAPYTFATSLRSPSSLAADSAGIYWHEERTEYKEEATETTHEIRRVGWDGGDPVVFTSEAGQVQDIALSPTHVTWATYVGPEGDGDIRRKAR